MHLDVKSFALAQREKIKKGLAETKNPTLVIFVTQHDPATDCYCRNKEKVAADVGIKAVVVDLYDRSLEDIRNILRETHCPSILQLPLRKDLEKHKDELIALLGFNDVDGLSPDSPFTPATALGIAEYIDTLPIPIGAHVLIINRSELIGKPLAKRLLEMNYTVTVAHSKTMKPVLKALMHDADIIVTATGIEDFILFGLVRPGTVVIDAGITRGKDGKIVGDCSQVLKDLKDVFVTPVPGGVGQLTTTFLMRNVAEWYECQI